MTITLQAVNELIASLESAGELSIKETKVMALAKAYQQLAAENARYSMSAGHADQRMAESRAVRSALGFKPDADDVSPSDLVEAINQTVAELCVIRTAHPQPLGPAMDAAIDAFNAEEMPETGMLNAYFILRESIRIKTPATDRIVAGFKADGVAEREKTITFTAAKKRTQDGVALIAIGKPYKIHNDDVIGEFFIGERGRYGVITMDRLNYFATSDEYAWAFSLREGADK
ncbi:TPA: hypothetical protein ACTYPP_004357 [Klebsiella pneumoniae]|uniref:hypothetical protein n=1 Tax=Klebsiella pneumoniae TaxID=573 RepID=UPI000CAC5639|nr:hypothetical protein GZ73_24825 [Klebsiella pneumoniae]SYC65644.1 Uncharacterised protein [Klebsiella pneumoniae]